MMDGLGNVLKKQDPNTDFIAEHRHIKWVFNYLDFFLLILLRCFAHVVNLACKEMLIDAANSGFNQVKKLQSVIVYVSFLSFFV